MIMTYTLAKGQSQRSLGSKISVETDGGDCITSRGNAVGKYCRLQPEVYTESQLAS